MIVRINGEEREIVARDLESLIEELEYGDATVATALNQNFVRKKDRAATPLKAGDEIEILTPRQGG